MTSAEQNDLRNEIKGGFINLEDIEYAKEIGSITNEEYEIAVKIYHEEITG